MGKKGLCCYYLFCFVLRIDKQTFIVFTFHVSHSSSNLAVCFLTMTFLFIVEPIEEVIARLSSQPDPAPLFAQEIKELEQHITTTQQNMAGNEALKKTYETSKDADALDVVTKQLAENREKIASLESQKAQLVAALKKITGGKDDDKKQQAKVDICLF